MHVSSNRSLSGLYSWPLAVTRPIQFIFRIKKKLDVSIVANGGVFDPLATAKVMNFGDLVALETQTADVLVNSNVGYRLSFSSRNEGRLKHSEFSVFVPYTLSVSGAQVNLVSSNSNPVVVSSAPGMSPPGGFVVPLNIQIGNLSGGETGGTYTDVVQLNIEAF